MNAPQKQPCSLLVGLVVGTLLFLWLSVWETAAQAQQQRDCVADLFKEMQNLGIQVNLQKDPQDFKTDRNNAKNAIQNAIKANKLAAGEDTMFDKAVEAIACHLADTPNLPVVQAERQTRLKEAVAKLRNLFQRIANPAAGADDLKDWLAKLFFLAPEGFLKFKRNGTYTWNLVRLELVLNQAGAAQEGQFVVQQGWTKVDLVLLALNFVSSQIVKHLEWQCQGVSCFYSLFLDGLFFIQTKDVDNANSVLFTQQGGQQVAGGQGTLQHYSEITLKHIGANAAKWRNLYKPGQQACMIPPGIGFIIPTRCGKLPQLPNLEFIIGILFRGMPLNADQVKKEITGLGLAAGQLNAAQRAVQAALNAETKGLAVGWTALVQQKAQQQYSCAAVDRTNKVWVNCDIASARRANNPLRFFFPGDAASFVCMAFGIGGREECKAQEK
jgi:hypothetical protein